MGKPINYVAPFILDTIFKHPGGVDPITSEPTGDLKEVKAELAVLWDDILSVQSYPYDGMTTWEKFNGDKFYLTLNNQGTHLCLGNFKQMFKLWRDYRIKYYSDEDDGQDSED